MLLENESELRECKANVFFQRIRLRQPVWSYTPITIIISMALNRLLFTLLTSHFQCKKVGSYHLIHYWMRVVLFLFKTNLFQAVLFPITLYFYFADSQQLMH